MARIIAFIMILAFAVTLTAQDDDAEAPNYRVDVLGYTVSADNTEVIVNYSLYNSGGNATEEASVRLVRLNNGEEIATASVDPIPGNGGNRDDLSLRFPVTLFEPGENLFLSVIVEIDEEDPLDTSNNSATETITIPDYDPAAVEAAQQTTEDEPTTQPATSEDESGVLDDLPVEVDLWWLDLPVETNNPRHIALIAGFITVLMLVALIIKIILRLFRRSPSFGNWQPPYATMPPLDPNSTLGRRQSWQQHAQNNIVPVPCQRGVIHPRKALYGMDGDYLSGWRIIAVRMTQYDMYGRVSRSQVLASGGMVKRLTGTAQRNHKLNADKIARRVRPVAKKLARQFKKKITKRSAMLPIALDVRLRGRHGEVRIIFELYDCDNGVPRRIDYWEPEMTVVGKTIYESFTYTIYGQSGNESYNEFRKRLPQDIERVLTEMLRAPVSADAQQEPSYQGPSPDTLEGTQQVEVQSPSPETQT